MVVGPSNRYPIITVLNNSLLYVAIKAYRTKEKIDKLTRIEKLKILTVTIAVSLIAFKSYSFYRKSDVSLMRIFKPITDLLKIGERARGLLPANQED